MTAIRAIGIVLLLLGHDGFACAQDTDDPRYKFGGALRVRGEAWNKFLFRQDASDSFALLQRLPQTPRARIR